MSSSASLGTDAAKLEQLGDWRDPGDCPICHRDACDDIAHMPPEDGLPPVGEYGERPTNGDAPDESFVGDFTCAKDIANEPAPEAIVEDAVYCGGITVFAGESGSGKSFTVTSAGAAVAQGHEWHGRGVTQGSVAYVAFEADALPSRFRALEQNGDELDNFFVFRATDPLSPSVQRDGAELPSFGEQLLTDRLHRLAAKLEQTNRPPTTLLIVDTIRASLHGSEDSSESVSAYLRAIRRILATLPEAGALLVHHSGWTDGLVQRKRERGSSAFRGNVEATLFLEVVDDSDPAAVRLELKTLKARDSEMRVPLRLIRQRVDLPAFDKFGNPLSSCIIEADPLSFEQRQQHDEAEKAAKLVAEQQALDKQILATVRDYQPTSQEQIRAIVGCNRPKAVAAISRLFQQRLVEKPKKREPFTLTEAGNEALL